MDVPWVLGSQGIRREIIACGWMRIRRLLGEEAEARQGVRSNDDVRREEFHVYEERILQAARFNGALGKGRGCTKILIADSESESVRHRTAARHPKHVGASEQLPWLRPIGSEFTVQASNVFAGERPAQHHGSPELLQDEQR